MSRRTKTPSGVIVAASTVKVFERRHPTPEKVQLRWSLPGIGAASRTYPNTTAGRRLEAKMRKELHELIGRGVPFDTGTREPIAWSPALVEAAAHETVAGRREKSLLEYARAFTELRWPDLDPRSVGDLIDVFAVAVWAHTEPEDRPDRARTVEFVREVLPPMPEEQMRELLTAMPAEVLAAGQQLQVASLPVADLADAKRIQAVMTVLNHKLDGTLGAPTYRRRRRMALNQMLAQAVRDGTLEGNPLGKLPTPKRARTVKRVNRREVVSLAAVRALLELCADDPVTRPWAAFLACGAFAGMRPAEIGDLTWDQLELPEDPASWGKAELAGTQQRPKKRTNAGQTRRRGRLKWREEGETRSVLLMPRLCEQLVAHRARIPAARRGPGMKVFINANGEPVNPNDASRVLRGLREAVFADEGSPHFLPDASHPLRALTPYRLRHHAATVWLAAGVPADEVAEMLGHSYATLLAVYAGFIRTDTSRTTALVDAWYAEHDADDVPEEDEDAAVDAALIDEAEDEAADSDSE